MILNYRTIGSGLENKRHEKIKDNLLVRSSYFTQRTEQLTTEPLTIFDLRSKDEIGHEPEVTIPNTNVVHYYLGGDFNKENNQTTENNEDSENENQVNLEYASSNMVQFYADLATCQELKALIQDIVRNPRPSLIHCTAGKDRTGVSSAIIMELLDFDRSVIYADYLTIDQNLIKLLERKFVSQFNIQITDNIRKLFTVDKSYLDSFYQAIFSQYETMENYITSFLELSCEEIKQFQKYCLTNTK